MKKQILFLATVLALLFSSCGGDDDNKEPNGDGNGNGNGDVTIDAIRVVLPDDLEEFDLDYEDETAVIEFKWVIQDDVTYKLLVSLNEDLSNPATFTLNNTGTQDVTHTEFDKIMEDAGVKAYNHGELFWVIQGAIGTVTATSTTRTMDVLRIFKPFVDPRDGEIYPVCRVVDPLTGASAVWLGANLRATKYSNGTELVEFEDYKFSTTANGNVSEEWVKLRGALYNWEAMMNGAEGAEVGEKVQGIAPEGWHIPTRTEWQFVKDAQGEFFGTTLRNATYWDPTGTNPGTDDIGFCMVASGHTWTVEEAHPIGEVNGSAFFWSSTQPKEGDEYPWNPALSDAVGDSWSFNGNDGGGAEYPYAKTRGFSVRCVLD